MVAGHTVDVPSQAVEGRGEASVCSIQVNNDVVSSFSPMQNEYTMEINVKKLQV